MKRELWVRSLSARTDTWNRPKGCPARDLEPHPVDPNRGIVEGGRVRGPRWTNPSKDRPKNLEGTGDGESGTVSTRPTLDPRSKKIFLLNVNNYTKQYTKYLPVGNFVHNNDKPPLPLTSKMSPVRSVRVPPFPVRVSVVSHPDLTSTGRKKEKRVEGRDPTPPHIRVRGFCRRQVGAGVDTRVTAGSPG